MVYMLPRTKYEIKSYCSKLGTKKIHMSDRCCDMCLDQTFLDKYKSGDEFYVNAGCLGWQLVTTIQLVLIDFCHLYICTGSTRR